MTANAPKKSANSLMNSIRSRAEDAPQAETAAPVSVPEQGRAATPAKQPRKTKAGGAGGKTVLVGGHFPPAVLKQLRLIAAEEDTTNQALIAEALDLLFIKKGKDRIQKL